jgi:hypothetical protein
MSSLSVSELRAHATNVEDHIAVVLNDFSEITGVTVEALTITPASTADSFSATYYVQLQITL